MFGTHEKVPTYIAQVISVYNMCFVMYCFHTISRPSLLVMQVNFVCIDVNINHIFLISNAY